jgi:hypothetical protein
MNSAVKQLKRESDAIQVDGFVVECSADGIKVDTPHGGFSARRAISCLVEPVAGDRVLVAGDPHEDLFIIAVLERQEPSTIRVVVEGDFSLGLPSGRFSIAAANGIDLVSARDMSMTSSELTVRSPKGSIFFENLTYMGMRFLAEIEGIKLLGGFFDTVMERISQKVKRSYRTVEELDTVRSGQIDYRAEKNMSLRGQNALMTARELVKIDGDQIHLG